MQSLILFAFFGYCAGAEEHVRHRHHECDHQEHEVCFNNIVHSLFNDRLMPKGDILNVGAHKGT